MKYNLNFCKKNWVIIVLGFYSSTIQSQDTPFGNKIVGNGDPLNYYLGHFPVVNSDGLDLHWYGGIRFGDATSSSVMQINNGKVGIGLVDPSYKLDIDNAGYGAKQIRWRAPGAQYGYTYSDSGGIGISNGDPYSELIYLQTGNKSLNFYTNSIQRAMIDVSGNFGIGTTNPRANLDVANDISDGKVGTVFGRLPEGDGTGLGTYLGVKGYATQGSDINNVKSFSIVHDFYGQTNSSINFYRGGGMLGGFITFNTSDNTEKMRIGTNGYVGIGTTSPDSKLTVNGNIHAKEVKIDLSIAAPDYVFANDYKLKTLQEVEQYIKENSHLPEIPSAQEFNKNGLMLAEMNMTLLKKVEELTLYMIAFKKELNVLNEENRIQKEEIKTLKENKK